MKNKILPIVSVVVVIIVLLLAVVVSRDSDNNQFKEFENNRNREVFKVKKVAVNCSNCIFTINGFSFGPSDYTKYEESSDFEYMYSTFYEEGEDYVTDYNKIKNEEGIHRPVFLAAILNTDKSVLRGYACGVINDKAYCIEGSKDGSKYKNNVKIIKEAYKDNLDQCFEGLGCYSCGKETVEETSFLACKDGYVATYYGEDLNCRLVATEGKGTCSDYDYD